MQLSLRDSSWLLASLLLLAASPTMSVPPPPGSRPLAAQPPADDNVQPIAGGNAQPIADGDARRIARGNARLNRELTSRLLSDAYTKFLSYRSDSNEGLRNVAMFEDRLHAAAFNSAGAIFGKLSRQNRPGGPTYQDFLFTGRFANTEGGENIDEASMFRWMSQYNDNYIGFSAGGNVAPSLWGMAKIAPEDHPEIVANPVFRNKVHFRPGFIRCGQPPDRSFYSKHASEGDGLEKIPREHVDAPFFMQITTVLTIDGHTCVFTRTGDYPMPYVFYVVYLQEKLLEAQELAHADEARNPDREAEEEAMWLVMKYQLALTSLVKDLVATINRLQLKGTIVRSLQPETLMVSSLNGRLVITSLENNWAVRVTRADTTVTAFNSNGQDPLKRFMYKPPEMGKKKTMVNALAYDRWMVGITAYLTLDLDRAAAAKRLNALRRDVGVPAQLRPRIADNPAHRNNILLQTQHWIQPLLHNDIAQRIWPDTTAVRFAADFDFFHEFYPLFEKNRAFFYPPRPMHELFGRLSAETLQVLEAIQPVKLARIRNAQGVEQQEQLAVLVFNAMHQRLVDRDQLALQATLRAITLDQQRRLSIELRDRPRQLPNQQPPLPNQAPQIPDQLPLPNQLPPLPNQQLPHPHQVPRIPNQGPPLLAQQLPPPPPGAIRLEREEAASSSSVHQTRPQLQRSRSHSVREAQALSEPSVRPPPTRSLSFTGDVGTLGSTHQQAQPGSQDTQGTGQPEGSRKRKGPD